MDGLCSQVLTWHGRFVQQPMFLFLKWAASREILPSAIFGEITFVSFYWAGFDLEKHEAENRQQKSLPVSNLRQFKRRSFTTKNSRMSARTLGLVYPWLLNRFSSFKRQAESLQLQLSGTGRHFPIRLRVRELCALQPSQTKVFMRESGADFQSRLSQNHGNCAWYVFVWASSY